MRARRHERPTEAGCTWPSGGSATLAYDASYQGESGGASHG